jgi:hypothetical protein
MFRPRLIQRARILMTDPAVFILPMPVQNVILLNTPNRLRKFKRDFPNQVSRRKRNRFNKLKVPFNSLAPYVPEGTEESDYLYSRDGNSQKILASPH